MATKTGVPAAPNRRKRRCNALKRGSAALQPPPHHARSWHGRAAEAQAGQGALHRHRRSWRAARPLFGGGGRRAHRPGRFRCGGLHKFAAAGSFRHHRCRPSENRSRSGPLRNLNPEIQIDTFETHAVQRECARYPSALRSCRRSIRSASTNAQPSRAASSRPTVVLPLPRGPIKKTQSFSVMNRLVGWVEGAERARPTIGVGAASRAAPRVRLGSPDLFGLVGLRRLPLLDPPYSSWIVTGDGARRKTRPIRSKGGSWPVNS